MDTAAASATMALYTPPLPEATTVPSSAAPTPRPLFQNPPRPQNPHPFHSPPPPRLTSNPNPNYPQLAPRPALPHAQDPPQLLYPVASSGRGFLSRPVSLAAVRPSQRPPFGFPYLDQGLGNPGFVRPNNMPHAILGPGQGSAGNVSGAGVMTGLVKVIHLPNSQQPKVGPASTSISDNNGHKELRDRNRDDALTTIRDRKLRVSDKASLYALCRSWLRNGFPEDTQSLDAVKSLPRPLPLAGELSDSPDKKAGAKEEEPEDQDSCEQLSEKELLQRHIKQAKRIRSRLKDQRFQRIERYKSRLALLLPPMMDQHFKNESAAAN